VLNTWLSSTERNPCPYSEFKVVDISEKRTFNPNIEEYFKELYLRTAFPPELLERLEKASRTLKQNILPRGVPIIEKVQRGEFGELLTSELMKEFHNYLLPVAKIRFKVRPDDTQHATDILALKLDKDGLINEVCYVECKLKTTSGTASAIDACKQLEDTYNSNFPDILRFVYARLAESKSSLCDAFETYMEDRNDTRDKDTFRISLCYEHSVWNEKTLENLQEATVSLQGLTVNIICISDLRKLTDELFAKIGATQVSDNE
jgi:Cap4 SAVED domain